MSKVFYNFRHNGELKKRQIAGGGRPSWLLVDRFISTEAQQRPAEHALISLKPNCESQLQSHDQQAVQPVFLKSMAFLCVQSAKLYK